MPLTLRTEEKVSQIAPPGSSLSVATLTGIPEVTSGADLADILIQALECAAFSPQAGDILAVTQKIVSKAEGRELDLTTLVPGEEAIRISRATGKPANAVEAILRESNTIVRMKTGVIIAETKHGFVMANAGIDQSNVVNSENNTAGKENCSSVLLLPIDPDASARALKDRLDSHFGSDLGVIITDSAGRAWRLGVIGIAIGAAGVPSLVDRRGEPDRSGRPLEVTEVAMADAVAAAAVLVMGEGAEGYPAALVRGLAVDAPATPARALLRPEGEDLFR